MATQNELFKRNISQVLRCIWLNKGISRIEISKNLQMDKSTVTKIVSLLLETGIVSELKEGSSKPVGGRKPVPLSINNDYGCVRGIEVQTDNYTAVIINLQGEEIYSVSHPISLNKNNLISIFLKIVKKLEPYTNKYGLLGIVLGLSGIMDSRRGVIIKSHPLYLYDRFNFCEEIEESISLPVFLENDANCGCWGELTSNRKNRPNNMLFILGDFRAIEVNKQSYPGIGFGFGLILNGEVHYGNHSTAGEFKSLFKKITNVNQFSFKDEVLRNIKDKPEELMILFRELARNLSLLISFLDIDEIVLGGEIESFFHSLKLILSQEIEANWSYDKQMEYNIKCSHQNNKTVAFGAGCMFLERLFGIPDMNNTNEENVVKGIELLEKIKDLQMTETLSI
ncbi:MAG: ROK family transcriptional regulator [Spirochaetaceae bacterium]|nr:ROK family transcriptional regulator [Spirochaetaceae bacterium]